MENINLTQNPNSDKFDKDIIQQQSFNIIKENSLLKNNTSNNKDYPVYNTSNKYNSEFSNDNYNNDEDNNLNLNININNYLSRQNLNSSTNNNTSSYNNYPKMKSSKILTKRNNTGKKKDIIIPKLKTNNLKRKYNYRNINNPIYQREDNDALKAKLLARIRQQKDSLNTLDYKINKINKNNQNNQNNNNNKRKEEILLPKKNKKEENGKIENTEKNEKGEKEESVHIPKILTFLRTFKNFAKPLKAHNDKIEKDNNNADNENINENNFSVNPNNSCFNFNPKLNPKIGKLNLNKRNKDNINKFCTDQNDIGDGNEGDDYIDYNRFTFRNNVEEDENAPFKTFNDINNNNNDNIYDYKDQKDSTDSDVNQNINIDEYNNRRYNNNYKAQNNKDRDDIKTIYRNNKFLEGQENNKYNKNKKLKIDEISPNFKQRRNSKKNIYKNLYKNFHFNDVNDNKPYYRKNYLKNKYSSPKPLPKAKAEDSNNSMYTYNNIPKSNINIHHLNNYNNFNDYDHNKNENDDSFQSLNISTKYRKPKINDSFQRSSYVNIKQIHKVNSYNFNDISADQINLPNNYHTSNRPTKDNKIHEIVININDSLDSFNNEHNFNTNNNLYSNRSPLKRKVYNTNTNTNNNYMKRSPLSSKQNGGVYDYYDNVDSSQNDDDEVYVKNKKNTNFSRFMEPFQKNENKKWYNEDSYYSFDIVNMNKIAKNKNLLYQKPLKSSNSNKNINNNSMYVKRVVHYDNKKDPLSDNNNFNVMNDSGISSNYKFKKDYTDYEDRENNVYDFDAPKAIKDSIDDNFSNSNSDFINDSSRENQFSINSDINTNKLNDSLSNTNTNQNNNNNNNNNYNNNNTNNNNNNNNINLYDKNINQTLSNRNNQNKEKIVYMKKLNTVYNFYQGTKKLFSKINNKVFKIHKKDSNKNDPLNQTDINIKNDVKSDNNNNYMKKNDIVTYQGNLTPRTVNESIGNKPTYSNKISGKTPIGEDNIQRNQKKDHIYINAKAINNKRFFMKKYYNFYLSKINKKINGSYFSKMKYNKAIKMPKKAIYYMTRENIKIYQIPNVNNCYFQKIFILNNNSYNIEHQQFCSFFSLGDNFNMNNNSNAESFINENSKKNIVDDSNKKIVNLKQNINNNDKCVGLLMSNDLNSIGDNAERESFSFKNNNTYLLNSNSNKKQKENIEINNFYFSLSPKKDKNKFEIQKIQPEKNNNLIILNNKDNKNINKYDYDYISSFKNNKLSTNNNLLPQNVIDHLENMNKTSESVPFSFNQNDKEEETKKIKKLKKEELTKIIKRYLSANKKEEIKKKIDKNFNTDKSQQPQSNNATNENMTNSPDVKTKMEWARNDLSKEIEQAEKYIKDLKKKMEENTKKNDITCLLNMLTVDNFNDILNKIINLTTKENDEVLPDKDIIYNEYILIKVITDKAITEKRFVNLYAKLCYELYNKLKDKIYNEVNFKTILMEECKTKFNELNNINKDDNSPDTNNNSINIEDEKYYLIKKKFLGNIDFICELINVNILTQDFGFYYLEELYKQYNNITGTNEIDKFKKNLCLEAIVNFLSKFGKKINESKNMNNFKNLNDFINNNLNAILKDENLPSFLKYKIINLIEKQKNKWEDSLFEKSILAKGKKNIKKNNNNNLSLNKSHKSRKRKHLSVSPDNIISNKNSTDNNNSKYSANTNKNSNNIISSLNIINTNNNNEEIIKLIEKDIEKYGVFLNENNIINRSQLYKNNQIGNEYDWSQIEDILSQNKIDLGEIIRCYVEVCIDQITNDAKIFIANDYIKNIIYYYSTNLTNKEKDIIHNKMVTLFMNIQDICIDNFIMKEIMGYLLFVLIENKLYFIKDLNNFIGMDIEIIKTIAEVIKYTIISSEAKSKKFHNDFKQTKLFVDNSIFNDYVTNKIQDTLNNL